MPTAEVAIDEQLVRRLLREQHPDLAEQPLRPLANGWDNVLLRLGPDLVVRLPRRRLAAVLVAHEQRVLPELAASLPLPVPVPLRAGRPTDYYPWAWSVVPWLPGHPAATDPPGTRAAWAPALAGFLAALHRPAAAYAPANPVRGVPLVTRAADVEARLDSGSIARAEELRTVWHQALTAPVHSGAPVWLHGDPHPLNLLTEHRRLTAVIDFGDVTRGDPATDLATAWLTFDDAGRAAFVTAYRNLTQVDTATWRRARGWAVVLATAMAAFSDDHPELAAVAAHTITQVVDHQG
jgi:aminoglycoside phosphotransferase (APT) family kinase protein